jgi:hypothetical protein
MRTRASAWRSKPRAGPADRRAWPAPMHALGQRPGVHLAEHGGLGQRSQSRAGSHPARPPHAERPCQELPRTVVRPVPQHQLVPHAWRCPPKGWQQKYNCERPHGSLDYRIPEEFKRACEESRAMALLSSQNINHQQELESPVMNG